MNQNVERIEENGNVLAIVARSSYDEDGLNFFTPEEFPFQLGIHKRKQGEHVKPHKHIPFEILKDLTPQEFFYVEEGKVEVGLYNDEKLHSKVELTKGDMIIINCAHDIKFIEDSKMIEIKQGPYRGKDVEKEYF